MKKHLKKIMAGLIALCMALSMLPAYAAAGNGTANLAGVKSSNASAHEYTNGLRWANRVQSYLIENSDGSLSRVEFTGPYVVVETYSAAAKLLSTKNLTVELGKFGGFYSGETHNYLVFGHDNYQESNSQEVIRVVKYTKSWQRVGAASIYGANTVEPFHSGLRMAETGGKLFIHSSHVQYTTAMDGLRHQTNMTFVVDEATMTVLEQFCDVGARPYGYSSHSFNQFIETDGTYVYTVDHGDAYPRSVVVNRGSAAGGGYSSKELDLLTIPGKIGENDTGVSVGGFALSKENCLVVGNAVDFNTYGKSGWSQGKRNIFLAVADKELNSSKVIYLTNYTGSVNRAGNPHIAACGNDRFLILWDERGTNGSGVVAVQGVLVDGSGNTIATNRFPGLRLSDCQPILLKNGRVAWYYSDGVNPVLCRIDPDTFPDTQDSSQWYFDYIKWGKGQRIINGHDDGTFQPGGAMNRASFVTILWNIAGNPAPKGQNPFKDVKTTDWYYKQVVWAAEQGYMNGVGNGKFDPNGNMLRCQVAQAFYNMFGEGQKPAGKLPFTDVSTKAWYYDAVAWANGEGIANGTSLTTFQPEKNLTRAEAVTFIYNAWSYMTTIRSR